MKPRQVANWLLDENKSDNKISNVERMTGVMDVKEIRKLRKELEDQEVIRERQENAERNK